MEEAFLQDLFKSFNNSGLGYCVLRNYETLPKSLGGSDLDMAILSKQKEAVGELVLKIALRYGGKPIVDYVSSGRFIRLLGCHEGIWWGAAIDLFWMMEYRGVEYIPSADIIDRAKDYRGIKVARDDDASSIALVKELLSNGKTRKNYFPQLAELYGEHGDDTLHVLRHTFDTETISRLAKLLNQSDDGEVVIEELSYQLRRDVLGRSDAKKIEGRVRNFVWRWHRIFKPVGMSIAVLGTDGAGKTTLIEAIKPVLERSIHNQLEYQHLRPNWLPALGVTIGKRAAGAGGVVTDPHAQNPSGFVGSLIRLAYYSVDYTVGYWLKIYPNLVKRPHICLFDRYYYDFIIDPRRMRIALPAWLITLAFVWAPRPKIVLCLGAKPEVIFARKPETSLEEVERQVHKLKQFAEATENAVWIDTAQDIQGAVGEILCVIQTTMSNRY